MSPQDKTSPLVSGAELQFGLIDELAIMRRETCRTAGIRAYHIVSIPAVIGRHGRMACVARIFIRTPQYQERSHMPLVARIADLVGCNHAGGVECCPKGSGAAPLANRVVGQSGRCVAACQAKWLRACCAPGHEHECCQAPIRSAAWRAWAAGHEKWHSHRHKTPPIPGRGHDRLRFAAVPSMWLQR